jgi:hypothetical protein
VNTTIKISILEQDEVWLPYGATKPVKLKDMAPGHIANLIRFLERKKRMLKNATDLYWAHVAGTHDGGEMAQDALDNIAERLLEQDLDEWFEERPLIIKLRKLQKKYDKKMNIPKLEDAVARMRYEEGIGYRSLQGQIFDATIDDLFPPEQKSST